VFEGNCELMDQMKTCAGCGSHKNIELFYKDKAKADGHKTTCGECVKANTRKYYEKHGTAIYQKHRDAILARKQVYNVEHRDKKYATYLRFKVKNPSYYKTMVAAYRARKLQATPAWANMDTIKAIYANCPEGYHVDHIIPLKGKNVSGLHVEGNLQYLPASENLSKSNKVEVAHGR
jgi:hypothetical protein